RYVGEIGQVLLAPVARIEWMRADEDAHGRPRGVCAQRGTPTPHELQFGVGRRDRLRRSDKEHDRLVRREADLVTELSTRRRAPLEPPIERLGAGDPGGGGMWGVERHGP